MLMMHARHILIFLLVMLAVQQNHHLRNKRIIISGFDGIPGIFLSPP